MALTIEFRTKFKEHYPWWGMVISLLFNLFSHTLLAKSNFHNTVKGNTNIISIIWCSRQIDISVHLITCVTNLKWFFAVLKTIFYVNNTKYRFYLSKIILYHINFRCFRFEPEAISEKRLFFFPSNSRDFVRDGPVIEDSWSGSLGGQSEIYFQQIGRSFRFRTG